jgi:hypothetical protein
MAELIVFGLIATSPIIDAFRSGVRYPTLSQCQAAGEAQEALTGRRWTCRIYDMRGRPFPPQ